ncbi:ankyrin repeat containing [Pyrenophora seminiperda CCB06]|uniref:Ankyrin repeat containing n=1 Tax=Pyrenophora seminiperda CCB06 TaxID=1302712 RepID=A0A3M7MAF8_9PLEO|nr:ankyrin repeat containing [Pyrenophora seminiperda CCB06]
MTAGEGLTRDTSALDALARSDPSWRMRHRDDDDTEELQEELRQATSKEYRRRLQNRIAQRNHPSELQQEDLDAVISQTYSHQHLDAQDEPGLDDNAPEFNLLNSTDATPPLPSTLDLSLPPPLSLSQSFSMDRLSKRNSRRMSANCSFCASCGAVDNMIDPSLLLDVPMSPGRGRQTDWQVVGSPIAFDDPLADHNFITTTTQANTNTNGGAGGVESHVGGGSGGGGGGRSSRSRNSILNTTCHPTQTQHHQHYRSQTPDALNAVGQSHLHNSPSPSSPNNNITCCPHPHQTQSSSRRLNHHHCSSSSASHKNSSTSSSSTSPSPASHPQRRPSASASSSAPTPTSRYVNLKAGTSSDWTTPLHIAVEKGHEKLVRLLLMQGGNVNEKDARGSTVLHKAASKGYESVVRVLLEAPGLDLDVVDAEGWTALHRAAESGNEVVVLLFLGHAAAAAAAAAAAGSSSS